MVSREVRQAQTRQHLCQDDSFVTLQLSTAAVTQGPQRAFYPPRLLQFPQHVSSQAEIWLCSKGVGVGGKHGGKHEGKHEGKPKGQHKTLRVCCARTGALGAGPAAGTQRPLAAAAPAVSRDVARRARGAGALLGGEAPSCSCAGRRGRVGPVLRERSGQRPPPPRRAAWTPTITVGSSQVGARGAGSSGEGVGHGRARGLGGTAAGPWPEGSPAFIAAIVRCPAVRQSLSGFVCSRGWFVRTALFSCPVRAGARPAPVRFL